MAGRCSGRYSGETLERLKLHSSAGVGQWNGKISSSRLLLFEKFAAFLCEIDNEQASGNQSIKQLRAELTLLFKVLTDDRRNFRVLVIKNAI